MKIEVLLILFHHSIISQFHSIQLQTKFHTKRIKFYQHKLSIQNYIFTKILQYHKQSKNQQKSIKIPQKY